MWGQPPRLSLERTRRGGRIRPPRERSERSPAHPIPEDCFRGKVARRAPHTPSPDECVRGYAYLPVETYSRSNLWARVSPGSAINCCRSGGLSTSTAIPASCSTTHALPVACAAA